MHQHLLDSRRNSGALLSPCMECDASKSLPAVKSGADFFPRDRPPHAGVGYLVAPNYTKSLAC